MKTIIGFMLGIALGILITSEAINHVASAEEGDEISVATENGDTNGDGKVDISDAVYILEWLFLGGADLVPIDCDPPPPTDIAKFRMICDIRCGDNAATATLEFCGDTVVDSTDPPGTFIPSECMEVEAVGPCPVKISVTAPGCEPMEFCGEVPVEPDLLYDFFLVFDGGQPAVKISIRDLNEVGLCPTAQKTYDGDLDGTCSPAFGLGAGAGAGAWSDN